MQNQDIYDNYEKASKGLIDPNWAIAGGLDSETKRYLKSAFETGFDNFVLKGVSQGLGCATGKFSPTFVLNFAKTYIDFLRANRVLFFEDVLCFCQSLRNPLHPAHRLEGGVKLDLSCSQKENFDSLSKALLNNKYACLFEQEYHRLPLVSDSEEDLLRWDRAKDLLTTALLLTAIPARVPTISEVTADEILEAREKLRDLLPPFRSSILKAAWEIAKASRETSQKEVMGLAQLYYETNIVPSIFEIESKIKSESKKLFRKLIEQGVDKATLVAKALDPTEPFSKWDLIGSGLKSLLDIDSSWQSKVKIKGPYEFLIRLPSVIRRKRY
ncbi:MAG: hypothetical protein GH152_01930 [Dehalococcoidia bacterium]|nr:hypothetical protein [Dehalococcoidia bacterium]